MEKSVCERDWKDRRVDDETKKEKLNNECILIQLSRV